MKIKNLKITFVDIKKQVKYNFNSEMIIKDLYKLKIKKNNFIHFF